MKAKARHIAGIVVSTVWGLALFPVFVFAGWAASRCKG